MSVRSGTQKPGKVPLKRKPERKSISEEKEPSNTKTPATKLANAGTPGEVLAGSPIPISETESKSAGTTTVTYQNETSGSHISKKPLVKGHSNLISNEVDAPLSTVHETEEVARANSLALTERAQHNWQKIEPREVIRKDHREKRRSAMLAGDLPKSTTQETLNVPRVGDSVEIDVEAGSIGSAHDLRDRASSRVSLLSKRSENFMSKLQQASVVLPPGAEENAKSVLANNDSFIRAAIPCLPLWLSVICLLLNTVLPGSGTMLSGFSTLCCGTSRLQLKEDARMVTVCANIWVGFAQLMTITFLFVGWFWSIAWGINMVIISVERKRELDKIANQNREKKLQALTLKALN